MIFDIKISPCHFKRHIKRSHSKSMLSNIDHHLHHHQHEIWLTAKSSLKGSHVWAHQSVNVCACVCVCMWVREREREVGRDYKRLQSCKNEKTNEHQSYAMKKLSSCRDLTIQLFISPMASKKRFCCVWRNSSLCCWFTFNIRHLLHNSLFYCAECNKLI